MRHRFFFLLLLIGLSACTMQMEVVTPVSPATQPATLTFTPAAPDTSTPVIDQQLTVTPPALPTNTLISIPSSTPFPVDANIHPIHFAPSGTYVDILDSLAAGATTTYSVNAMQGQIMSVSVRVSPDNSWAVVPLKIVGADGSVLCPTQANESCYFWRGTLPATQDYLITLSPDVDVTDFMLRVAVDPPGTSGQSFPYRSINSMMFFTYTDEFAPVLFPEMYMTKLAPEVALQFIDTKSIDNTNLIEAYFLLGSSFDPAVVASCREPGSFGGPETITGEVTLDGVSFTRSEAAGVGAGNIYEQTFYRTAYQGTCYEITFLTHSANIGNYPADSGVREYDRAALLQKFEAIISSLVIK